MDEVTQDQVEAGQAVYGKLTLVAYDKLVLGVSCSYLWRCDAATLLARYDRLVSNNHLDVGVGSGYFLDHCRFPSRTPRVALMDLNESSLAHTAQRISRYNPECYRRNVLEDMTVSGKAFNSVGMNLLLHCVPGDFAYKGRIFDHALTVMAPGAVLFGATIVSQGIKANWFARRLMNLYVRKGIFSNQHDSADALRAELEARFVDVQVEVKGCMALFSARAASSNGTQK